MHGTICRPEFNHKLNYYSVVIICEFVPSPSAELTAAFWPETRATAGHRCATGDQSEATCATRRSQLTTKHCPPVHTATQTSGLRSASFVFMQLGRYGALRARHQVDIILMKTSSYLCLKPNVCQLFCGDVIECQAG